MGNMVAMRFFLVRFCRERWLGERDDGRCNNENTHEGLHYIVGPSLSVSCCVNPAAIWRERARTKVIL
jgi:hypothetical protein